MTVRSIAVLPLSAALFVFSLGCSNSKVGFSPSNYSGGGGANMTTYIVSPQANQTFPAGQDIAIEASAIDFSGVSQVSILVNGKTIAKDTQAPYTGLLVQPKPGQYEIQSYAVNRSGDAKLSPSLYITVK